MWWWLIDNDWFSILIGMQQVFKYPISGAFCLNSFRYFNSCRILSAIKLRRWWSCQMNSLLAPLLAVIMQRFKSELNEIQNFDYNKWWKETSKVKPSTWNINTWNLLQFLCSSEEESHFTGWASQVHPSSYYFWQNSRDII